MPSAGDIRAGRAYVELGTDDAPLDRGLLGAQNKLAAFNKTMKTLRGAGLAAGVSFLAREFAEATGKFKDVYAQIASGSLSATEGTIQLTNAALAAIPIFGSFYTAFSNIRDVLDGTAADIARVVAETEKMSKVTQGLVKVSALLQTAKERTAQLGEQRALGGLPGGAEKEQLQAIIEYRRELRRIEEEKRKVRQSGAIPERKQAALEQLDAQALAAWQLHMQKVNAPATSIIADLDNQLRQLTTTPLQRALEDVAGAKFLPATLAKIVEGYEKLDAAKRANRDAEIDATRAADDLNLVLRTRAELAEAEIDADTTLTATQKELAKLELERKKQMEEAAAADAAWGDTEASEGVARLFALKRKILEAGGAASVKIQTLGSSSAQEITRQSWSNSRALKAAEATAKNTAATADALDGVASALAGGYPSFD